MLFCVDSEFFFFNLIARFCFRAWWRQCSLGKMRLSVSGDSAVIGFSNFIHQLQRNLNWSFTNFLLHLLLSPAQVECFVRKNQKMAAKQFLILSRVKGSHISLLRALLSHLTGGWKQTRANSVHTDDSCRITWWVLRCDRNYADGQRHEWSKVLTFICIHCAVTIAFISCFGE